MLMEVRPIASHQHTHSATGHRRADGTGVMPTWRAGRGQGSGGSVSGATLRERVGYTVTIYGREWVRAIGGWARGCTLLFRANDCSPIPGNR